MTGTASPSPDFRARTGTHEPKYEDFTCPRCKAGVGRPCTLRRPQRTGCLPVHAPRYDKWAKAHARWRAADRPDERDAPRGADPNPGASRTGL